MKSKKAQPSKEKYKDTFSAQEVGVMLEGIKSDFSILSEKVESLEEKFSEKVDGLEEKIVNLTDSVNIIAINQTKTLDRVAALEVGQKLLIQRVDMLEKKINALETDMNRRFNKVDADIKEIKDSLKIQVDLHKFIVLESRVTKIESQLSSFLAK